MNKFVILAFFALAAGALADYAKPAAYHAPAHHAPAPAHYGHEHKHEYKQEHKHEHKGYGHEHGHGHGHGHGYGHGHAVVHSYPVHAPHAKCGANLLVGCAPSVAHVPCHPVKEHHGHGYGHAPAHHGYRAPESDAFDQFEE